MLFALLCILSFVLQNICCKEYGKRYPDTLYAQAVMTALSLAAVVVIMAALGGAQVLTAEGYLIAFAFGVFFVLTLTTMTLAINSGHMGLTLLIQNCSLLAPTVYGIAAWGEKLTLFKGLGIAFILAMLALSAGDRSAAGTHENWNRRRWVVLTGLTLFGDSILGVLQGMMSRVSAEVSSVTFTFWTSIFSIAVAGGIILFCKLKGNADRIAVGGREKRIFAGLIAGIGVGTAGGNCFSILALTALQGVIFFPLRQGALVLLMWLAGVLIYREKITRRGVAMLAAGLTGLILLNIA